MTMKSGNGHLVALSTRVSLCASLVALTFVSCVDADGPSIVERQAAVTQNANVVIRLPATVTPGAVVLSANGILRLADRVSIPASASSATGMANAGTSETTVGKDARVRDIWSLAPVVLNDRTRADGSVRSAGTVTLKVGAVVTGNTVPNAILSPPSLTSWSVALPTSNQGDVNVAPSAQKSLAPGSYRNLSVNSRATLNLVAGTYFFVAATIEPQAVISLDTTGGAVVVYLQGAFTFRGAINDRQGRGDFLVVPLSASPVVIDSAFVGTVVAPQAAMTLASATHTGAFFAKDIDVRADVVLVAKPFQALPPNTCTGAPDHRACNDGSPCTANDACSKGKCQGSPVTCPSTGNQCVEAFCDPRTGACLRAPLEGKGCNDGNPATTGEICYGGVCGVVTANAPDTFCPSQALRIGQYLQDPNAWKATRDVEERLRSYQAVGATNQELLAFSDFLVIPVVFHVLENAGAEAVTDAQLQAQIDNLNNFYGTAHFNVAAHSSVAAGTHIQFQLAARSPTCGATNGIDRVPTATTEFVAPLPGGTAPDPWADPTKGGVPAWDSRKYLNIWVAAYRPNTSAPGFNFAEVARSQFPTRAGLSDDGLVLDVSPLAFSTAFDSGNEMVIPHEVGHYLNLLHTDTPNDQRRALRQPVSCTGAGTAAATCEQEGDKVCDTPATTDSGSASCTTSLNTCVDAPVDGTDLVESIMLSTASTCHNLFTFGQGGRAEATLATTRSSLLASDGIVPPGPAADLWVRDGIGDVGQEPNALDVLWASDDIWVRQQPDGVEMQQHQNPIFRPGNPNHVYVRIRNRGCQQAENATVTLRWAKASTSLGWPQPWDGSQTVPANGASLGNVVGTQSTGVLGPGASTVIAFDWDPADPSLYASFGGDQSHFCLLAHIGAVASTPQDLGQLVRSNNNIAWKNVTVTTDGGGLMASVGIGGGQAGTQQLRFTQANTLVAGSVFDWGSIVVDLGTGLFARWIEGGGRGTGIDGEGISGTRIPLLQSGATLDNIPLQASDLFTLRVEFVPFAGEGSAQRGGIDVYQMDVTQLSEAVTPHRVVGGQRFVLKTRQPAPTVSDPG